MKYINKICIITLISNNIIAEKHNFNYITEKDIKESTTDKFYLYPLEINEKSYIKTQEDNKRYIMIDHGKVFCIFKYNKKIYILSTNCCYCCYNNCYATLIKNKYSDSIFLSPEFQNLEEELKNNNIKPIDFEYSSFLICNEFLKFINKKCCTSCKPKFFSNIKNNKNINKMILITDNDFENKAVTLDLVENVKIIDEYEELNIIAKKTDNEMKTIIENKDYIK